MRNVLTVIGLVMLAALAAAQTFPYVDAGAGIIGNMGYKNPDIRFGAGVTYAHAAWEFDSRAEFSTANKYFGDGYSYHTEGTVYWFPRRGATGIGLGGEWGETRTSQYQKGAWAPHLALRQYMGDAFIFSAHYTPSGTDYHNFVHRGGFEIEMPVRRHLSLTMTTVLAMYRPTDCAACDWRLGGGAWGGVRYRF